MPMDEFNQTVNRISKSYAYKNEIPEIILSNLLYMDNYLYIDEAGITFRYLYSDEVKVTNEISILDKGGKLLEVPDEEIKEIEENFEIQYSDTQRKAFPLVTRPGISILTGGRHRENNNRARADRVVPPGRTQTRRLRCAHRPGVRQRNCQSPPDIRHQRSVCSLITVRFPGCRAVPRTRITQWKQI